MVNNVGFRGFPNTVDLWGYPLEHNDQKLHETFNINIFWAKQWGEQWRRGVDKLICRVVGVGEIPPPPPLGETMFTTCSLIKKQIFAISDIIIVTVIIDAISTQGFSTKNAFTLVIR